MIQVKFHERFQQVVSGVESKIVNQELKELEFVNLSDGVKDFEGFGVQLVDVQLDEGKHSRLVKILLEGLLNLFPWNLVVHDDRFVQELQLVYYELVAYYWGRLLWLVFCGILLLIYGLVWVIFKVNECLQKLTPVQVAHDLPLRLLAYHEHQAFEQAIFRQI